MIKDNTAEWNYYILIIDVLSEEVTVKILFVSKKRCLLYKEIKKRCLPCNKITVTFKSTFRPGSLLLLALVIRHSGPDDGPI